MTVGNGRSAKASVVCGWFVGDPQPWKIMKRFKGYDNLRLTETTAGFTVPENPIFTCVSTVPLIKEISIVAKSTGLHHISIVEIIGTTWIFVLGIIIIIHSEFVTSSCFGINISCWRKNLQANYIHVASISHSRPVTRSTNVNCSLCIC